MKIKPELENLELYTSLRKVLDTIKNEKELLENKNQELKNHDQKELTTSNEVKHTYNLRNKEDIKNKEHKNLQEINNNKKQNQNKRTKHEDDLHTRKEKNYLEEKKKIHNERTGTSKDISHKIHTKKLDKNIKERKSCVSYKLNENSLSKSITPNDEYNKENSILIHKNNKKQDFKHVNCVITKQGKSVNKLYTESFLDDKINEDKKGEKKYETRCTEMISKLNFKSDQQKTIKIKKAQTDIAARITPKKLKCNIESLLLLNEDEKRNEKCIMIEHKDSIIKLQTDESLEHRENEIENKPEKMSEFLTVENINYLTKDNTSNNKFTIREKKIKIIKESKPQTDILARSNFNKTVHDIRPLTLLEQNAEHEFKHVNSIILDQKIFSEKLQTDKTLQGMEIFKENKYKQGIETWTTENFNPEIKVISNIELIKEESRIKNIIAQTDIPTGAIPKKFLNFKIKKQCNKDAKIVKRMQQEVQNNIPEICNQKESEEKDDIQLMDEMYKDIFGRERDLIAENLRPHIKVSAGNNYIQKKQLMDNKIDILNKVSQTDSKIKFPKHDEHKTKKYILNLEDKNSLHKNYDNPIKIYNFKVGINREKEEEGTCGKQTDIEKDGKRKIEIGAKDLLKLKSENPTKNERVIKLKNPYKKAQNQGHIDLSSFKKTSQKQGNSQVSEPKVYSPNMEVGNIFLNLSGIKPPQEIIFFLNKGYNNTINKEQYSKELYIEKTDIEYTVRTIINKETKKPPILQNLNPFQKFDINIMEMELETKLNKIIEKNKNKNKNKEEEMIFKTKKFLKNNNITLIMADKSKTLILISNNVYIELMEDSLRKNNFIQVQENTNAKAERKMQALFREMKEEGILNEHQYTDLYPSGCATPLVFGKLKIHKDPVAMRPIVNGSSAYFAKISKWLGKVLMKYVPKPHAIKNSIELKKNLIKIKIEPNDYMFSIDAQNMYSNLSRESIINFLMHRYKYDKEKPVKIKLSILNQLLHQCTTEICVEFNKKYYHQSEGMSMGGSLSPMFGEIALYLLENRFLKQSKLHIKYYCHYADDLYFLCSKNTAEETLKYINIISEKLQFTLEEENENKINFLDITIIRNSNSLDFRVFKKDTVNNLRINYNSDYSQNTKINILNQEVTRAYKISSTPSYLKQELQIITNVYLQNNYPLQLIEKVIANIDILAIKGFIKKEKEERDYHSIIINNFEIKQCLTKHVNKMKKNGEWHNLDNLNFVLPPPKTVYSELGYIGKTPQDPTEKQNIIYCAKCIFCNHRYVGCSERNYKIRYEEHIKSTTSSLTKHKQLGLPHDFNKSHDSFKILHFEKINIRRFIYESIVIDETNPELNCESGLKLLTRKH